jgi:hypothetical protein
LRPSLLFVALLLLGFVLCSRNNPLDPQAGNYDPGVNLLADPGFENGGSLWKMPNAGGRKIDSTVSHSGMCSEKIDMTTFNYPRAVWQTVSVVTGTVYTFSGWMKTDTVTLDVHMMVYWYSIPSPPESQSPSDTVNGFIKADTLARLTGKNDWTGFSRNYVAPSGALKAQIYLEGVPALGISKGTAWFDDLTFAAH